MKVSIIIPVHNNWYLTRECLHSLAKHTDLAVEVIMVDNASTDDTLELCPALGAELFGERFHYLRQERNLRFAIACNIGARTGTGEMLFFLNNDTVLLPGWLPPLLETLQNPPYPVLVGPLLLYPEFAGCKDRVQHLGIAVTPQMHLSHVYESFPASHPVCRHKRRYQALTGAALMIPRSLFISSGMFDEDFINGGEDIELCLRLKAQGYIATCAPQSRIYHLASQTPGIHDHAEHNAGVLKEKAFALLVPDLHTIAEEDGYIFALTPELRVFLDLPARRKELFAKQALRSPGCGTLAELLEREPLWHAGYQSLALELTRGGEHEKAADMLFLAYKMQPLLSTATQLHSVAQAAGHARYADFAATQVAALYLTEPRQLKEKACFMAGFAERLGMSSVQKAYAGWIAVQK